jgi:hypothetical protein
MQIDTLETTYSCLCQGGETLSILMSFYKLYKKLHEEIAVKLSDLAIELECNELVKTLSDAVGSSSQFIKQISAKHLEMSQ